MRHQPAACTVVLVLAALAGGCLGAEDSTVAVEIPTEALAVAPDAVPTMAADDPSPS